MFLEIRGIILSPDKRTKTGMRIIIFGYLNGTPFLSVGRTFYHAVSKTSVRIGE